MLKKITQIIKISQPFFRNSEKRISEYAKKYKNQNKDVWALLIRIVGRSAKKCKSIKFNDLNLLNQFIVALE